MLVKGKVSSGHADNLSPTPKFTKSPRLASRAKLPRPAPGRPSVALRSRAFSLAATSDLPRSPASVYPPPDREDLLHGRLGLQFSTLFRLRRQAVLRLAKPLEEPEPPFNACLFRLLQFSLQLLPFTAREPPFRGQGLPKRVGIVLVLAQGHDMFDPEVLLARMPCRLPLLEPGFALLQEKAASISSLERQDCMI